MTLTVTAVVGNPKPGSRTRAMAEYVAHAVADGDGEVTVVELSELSTRLFDWSDEAVKSAVATVLASDVAVISTPTYKASYTGLLKSFLDRFGAGDLAGTVVIPLMVAAAPHHAMAVESQLKPVLAELGAVMPTPALALLDSQVDQLGEVLADWTAVSAPLVAAVCQALAAP